MWFISSIVYLTWSKVTQQTLYATSLIHKADRYRVLTLPSLQSAIDFAKQQRLCVRGDCIVALHRIGNASVIKIVDIK